MLLILKIPSCAEFFHITQTSYPKLSQKCQLSLKKKLKKSSSKDAPIQKISTIKAIMRKFTDF